MSSVSEAVPPAREPEPRGDSSLLELLAEKNWAEATTVVSIMMTRGATTSAKQTSLLFDAPLGGAVVAKGASVTVYTPPINGWHRVEHTAVDETTCEGYVPANRLDLVPWWHTLSISFPRMLTAEMYFQPDGGTPIWRSASDPLWHVAKTSNGWALRYDDTLCAELTRGESDYPEAGLWQSRGAYTDDYGDDCGCECVHETADDESSAPSVDALTEGLGAALQKTTSQAVAAMPSKQQAIVGDLMGMGFKRSAVVEAMKVVNSGSMDPVLDHLFSMGERAQEGFVDTSEEQGEEQDEEQDEADTPEPELPELPSPSARAQQVALECSPIITDSSGRSAVELASDGNAPQDLVELLIAVMPWAVWTLSRAVRCRQWDVARALIREQDPVKPSRNSAMHQQVPLGAGGIRQCYRCQRQSYWKSGPTYCETCKLCLVCCKKPGATACKGPKGFTESRLGRGDGRIMKEWLLAEKLRKQAETEAAAKSGGVEVEVTSDGGAAPRRAVKVCSTDGSSSARAPDAVAVRFQTLMSPQSCNDAARVRKQLMPPCGNCGRSSMQRSSNVSVITCLHTQC
jgi:hypothetical protein